MPDSASASAGSLPFLILPGPVRLGCADAGRVSQFINPVPEAEGGRRGKKMDVAKDLAFRAKAAWADGLRQLSLSFVPEHSIKGDALPGRLNQVAFWMVRRNVSAQFSARQFTPIAVLIRPDQDCIMGRTAGMQQWVPYPELLRRLETGGTLALADDEGETEGDY